MRTITQKAKPPTFCEESWLHADVVTAVRALEGISLSILLPGLHDDGIPVRLPHREEIYVSHQTGQMTVVSGFISAH